jgi:biopolymer transport protein ExbD
MAKRSASRGEINITPLVDVVLVLLIIFMVVSPLMTQKIQVHVPDEAPTEGPPPVVVSVSTAGQFAINSKVVADANYVAELAKVLEAMPSGERLVFFTADADANYAKLVLALDGARQAGADTLGMATEKLAVAR